MNKLSVLAKNQNTYFIKRLKEELGEDLSLINPWENPETSASGTVLVRTTGVYGSNADLLWLEKQPNKIVNDPLALRLLRSKKTQYEFFPKAGIPHLPWLDLQDADLGLVQSFLQMYPLPRFIVKPHRGQGGWGVRALSAQDVGRFFQHSSDREYLLQPFLEQAQEYRFAFIGENWTWTLERTRAQGKAAANFQTEGKARSVDPDPRFHDLLKNLRREMPIHYGAIDLLVIENEIYVLEVNAVPGFEQLESASGRNIVRELLKSL